MASKLDEVIDNYNTHVNQGWNVPLSSQDVVAQPAKPPSGGRGGSKGASVNDYYNSILKSLGSSKILPDTITYEALGYTMPTQTELSAQIAEYLRPQYDSDISSRKAQTTQNRAAIDIDAASRGMGASTWVTDAKTRQMNSEAADIANLESNYGSERAEPVQPAPTEQAERGHVRQGQPAHRRSAERRQQNDGGTVERADAQGARRNSIRAGDGRLQPIEKPKGQRD